MNTRKLPKLRHFCSQPMYILYFNRMLTNNQHRFSTHQQRIAISVFGDGPRAAIWIVLRRDWKIELAVFEHLGPDSAVDAPPEVFDELAVYELRNRLASRAGVDCHSNSLSPAWLSGTSENNARQKANIDETDSKHVGSPFQFLLFVRMNSQYPGTIIRQAGGKAT